MLIFLTIFLTETVCCDPSSELSLLVETVQMKGHNIWFYAEFTKIIPNYHYLLPFI